MILITGANGFIGRSVVKEFSQKYNIRCLVRHSEGIEMNKNIELFFGDILNPEDCKKAAKGCFAIVHLAAIIKSKDEALLMKTNVLGTKNLAQAAEKNRVKKFVFVSSDTVLQEAKDSYGKSKEQAEKELSSFPNTVILRPTIVFGKGDDKNLSRWVKLVEKFPIIPLAGNGKNRMQPIFVGDVARYVRKAVELPVQGIFVLAGSQRISVLDFIKLVCKKKPLKRILLPMPLFLLRLAKPLMGLNDVQLKNLSIDRVYDITKTVEALQHAPCGLEEKIDEIL